MPLLVKTDSPITNLVILQYNASTKYFIGPVKVNCLWRPLLTVLYKTDCAKMKE